MPRQDNQELSIQYLLDATPQEAVDYLKAKEIKITGNWQELWQEAHAKAFTVAQMAKLDLLNDIHQEVIHAVKTGMSEKDFILSLQPKLEKSGWWGKKKVIKNGQEIEVQLGSPRRLKTILRTNMLTSYQAGRYLNQIANSDEQPYWEYVAVNDSRTRHAHKVLNGLVFKADDPIWDTIYPPNGWNCRCRVRALSQFRLGNKKVHDSRRMGFSSKQTQTTSYGKTYPAEITTFKGQIVTVPGWNHNVGKAAYGTDRWVAQKLQTVKNETLRQELIQSLNNNEYRQACFKNWVQTYFRVKQGIARGELTKEQGFRQVANFATVGFLDRDIHKAVQVLSNMEVNPSGLLVVTRDAISHADREAHHRDGIAVDIKAYLDLPLLLAKPELVLYDTEEKNLIYLYPSRNIKLVVDIPNQASSKKLKQSVDGMVTMYKLSKSEDGEKISQVESGYLRTKYKVILDRRKQ